MVMMSMVIEASLVCSFSGRAGIGSRRVQVAANGSASKYVVEPLVKMNSDLLLSEQIYVSCSRDLTSFFIFQQDSISYSDSAR